MNTPQDEPVDSCMACVLRVFQGWKRRGADMRKLASLEEVLGMTEGGLTRNETVRALNSLRHAGYLRRVRRGCESGYLLVVTGEAP